MWTLLLDGAFLMSPGGLLTDMILSGDAAIIISCMLFSVFILLTAVTLMNMLIGSLCEVVGSVTKDAKDEADIRLMKSTVLARLRAFDNGDGLLTRDEFWEGINESAKDFAALNIDERFLLQISSVLYPDSKSHIELDRATELMLMCRGDLPVTVHILAWANESLMTQVLDILKTSLPNSAPMSGA